ncbi:hypothetical protein AB6A40_006216 [Gnathostoma spinigerum]|uniref:GAF domain-containing protein n=1 Tax=Gnathostoma spinigerum TaxID=75299 RepID=A0ABD6ESI4_9BILA
MEPREEVVVAYLKAHPLFLENYVISSNISTETFNRWVRRRSVKVDKNVTQRKSLAALTPEDLTTYQKLLIEIGNNSDELIYELGVACSRLTHVEQCDVIVKDEMNESFHIIRDANGTLARKPIKMKRIPQYTQKLFKYNGIILGELCFYRNLSERDKNWINLFCAWGCAMLSLVQRNSLNDQDGFIDANTLEDSELQKRLNHFLLEVIKSIFQDIMSMDSLIKKVMAYARKLTNADRASLFLVDHKTNELYARIFDIGTEGKFSEQLDKRGQREIRFSAGKGISGYVASTGSSLNIEDAYEDPRFNPEIDIKTGYKTKSILCMPIFIRETVIGVVQMVNKHDGSFTKTDENAFEVFAIYCGLALHHAKLYDRIRRSEQVAFTIYSFEI